MSRFLTLRRHLLTGLLGLGVCLLATARVPAQQWVTEMRDPKRITCRTKISRSPITE